MDPHPFFGFAPGQRFACRIHGGKSRKDISVLRIFPLLSLLLPFTGSNGAQRKAPSRLLGTPMPWVNSKNVIAHPHCFSCCPTCIEDRERERLVASGPWAGYVIPYGSNHSTSYPGNILEMISALGGVEFARRWTVAYFLSRQRCHYGHGLAPPYPNHL